MPTGADGIHWREAGSGHAVLFVHGFPLHAGIWRRQLEDLPPLCRWIAPDLRGFGRSASLEPARSLDAFAEDLAGLLDHLAIESATVCGLSMGGYIAFALLRRQPERVRALVLCDTRAEADDEATRRGRLRSAQRARKEGTAWLASEMLPKLLAEGSRDAPIAAEVVAMVDSAPPEVVARAQEAMAERPDSRDLLGSADVPCIVVTGEHDAITPPEVGRSMAAAMPRARFVMLPGAGHLSPLERPEAFNHVLLDFLHDAGLLGG